MLSKEEGSWGQINLKLYALKNTAYSQTQERVQLIVVDLDKGKRYPLNFVCVLPRYFRILEKRSSKFAKIFGTRTLTMARTLLIDAENEEEDPEIKTVIKRRIKDIDAKQDCAIVEQ